MNITKLENLRDLDEKIQALVDEYDIDYIDAALEFCEINNVDIELVGELIAKNPNLKSKLQCAAEELNFIKKTTRLPLWTEQASANTI